MRKEIEKRPQIEGLVISPKTSEFLSRLEEIREINNGVVREKIFLGVFDDAIRKAASRERLTGFSHVSIQLMSGNSWQTFSGEKASLSESLITNKRTFDPTEGRRGSLLSCLYLDTIEQHTTFCRPGGGYMGQDNVTSHDYYININNDQGSLVRIVSTLGELSKMTKKEEKTLSVFYRTKGNEKRNKILRKGVRKFVMKINAAMEQVDSVSSFLQAPAEEWKRVFGNNQAA